MWRKGEINTMSQTPVAAQQKREQSSELESGRVVPRS